jgi:diguanylate cyclase (GGDEF)-like protein/PAS domain S-box-containing protein
VLKDKSLRYIFFVSLAIAIAFPLINIFLVYPLFSGLLIADATENAVNVAKHLRPPTEDFENLARLESSLMKMPQQLKEDFNLYKIRFISRDGTILYSTTPEEDGSVGDTTFAGNAIAKGEPVARLVQKEADTQNGRPVQLDVVESYVPVMDGKKFLGAFDVYSDITSSKHRLDRTVLYSSVIPFAASGSFMLMILFLLRRARNDLERRRKVEEELRFHRDSLEYIITERTAELKQTNEALMRSERFLSTTFDSIHDPFCIFDRDFRIVKANDAYARIKGKHVTDLVGEKCFDIIHGTQEVCEGCLVKTTFEDGRPAIKDKQTLLPDGGEAWFELHSYPIFAEGGSISHIIEYSREVTEKKMTELERKRLIEELEQLSRTDALTGVLNRRALALELDDEFRRALRYGKPLSVLLCDLDNLKDINDTYGHHAGDRALCNLADILTSLLRQHDLAGRYGGDEFMAILPDTALEGAGAFAERLRSKVADDEMVFFGLQVRMTMSIGVSTLLAGMAGPEDMIRPADEALYESKNSGRNMVTLARPSSGQAGGSHQHTIPFS